MAITTDALTSTLAAASANTTGTTSTNSMGSMLSKDAFLQILMTQLKYQDPLNPTDTTEFMSQLAQLSQVEQLTNISSSLDSMKKSTESGTVSQWINIIGHQINTSSSTISKGDSVVLAPSGDYDSIVLDLTNTSDGSVTQATINKGDSLTLTYSGDDKVKVSAHALKDSKIVGCTYSVYQTVQGIQSGTDGMVAVLSNGDQQKVSSITKIIN